MAPLLKFANMLDRFSRKTGSWLSWLTLAMVILGAFNAIARSLSKVLGVNLASNALIEAQWYLFSLVFLLGAAYVLQQNEHVRVDVLFGRLSPRAKAWINLFGAILFTLPFCWVMLYLCWPSVKASWYVWEQSPDPSGLPRYPIKTFVLVAFFLLNLQALADIIRNTALLRGWDPDPSTRAEAAS